MLIDPPFEQADELKRCTNSMKEAISRMRQTVAAIWYPIKDQRSLTRYYQDLTSTGAPKLLRVELYVHHQDSHRASMVRAWPLPTRRGAWKKSSRSCCRGSPKSWPRRTVATAWTGSSPNSIACL